MGQVSAVLLLGVLLGLAACADAPREPRAAGAGGAADEPEPSELIARATVLEDSGHGPQLCLGGVATSLPPQCGGPDITNWDWEAVGGSEEVRGTRWGDYVVVGTYVDGRFTLTRPAVPGQEYDGPMPVTPEEDDPFTTPCPAPEGGWKVVDPALTTDDSLERVSRVARRLEGYAGLWWDQSINPASASGSDEGAELMNDPAKLVVNVRVTGDPAAAEAELRKVWGGALCVSRAVRTEQELRRIQHRMVELPGFLSSGTGRDVVEVTVIHDDGQLQRRLDEEHGAGVVRVTSALQPHPG